MAQDEVMAEVRACGPAQLVEITGGEPMLQERELLPLMKRLIGEGYKVLMETSGERPLANVPAQVVKIVDVKCPGSGEGGKFRPENLTALNAQDELKFVIAGREDYDFAREFMRAHGLVIDSERDTALSPHPVANIIFSPAFRKDAAGARDSSHCLVDPRELVDWILADHLNVRIGLQIHKFIWDPSTKTV